jgi:excisionase family DNA binding protein
MALNLSQAAKLVGVSRNTLYAAIRDGRLACTMAGRPGKSTLVTLEALQQAGFPVPEETLNIERSAERAQRVERLKRPERPERSDIERPGAEGIELYAALERVERAVERLERSLDFAVDRVGERLERSIERSLERLIERLLARRAQEAVPAVPVRPLARSAPDRSSTKATVLAMLQELRDRGLSLQAIANQLNAEGVPTLSGKGHWHKRTISKLLAQAEEGSP